jgi:hypothetical protein
MMTFTFLALAKKDIRMSILAANGGQVEGAAMIK